MCEKGINDTVVTVQKKSLNEISFENLSNINLVRSSLGDTKFCIDLFVTLPLKKYTTKVLLWVKLLKNI